MLNAVGLGGYIIGTPSLNPSIGRFVFQMAVKDNPPINPNFCVEVFTCMADEEQADTLNNIKPDDYFAVMGELVIWENAVIVFANDIQVSSPVPQAV